MRIAQMWADIQQTGISMARLGDVLNTRTEVPPSAAAQLRPITGRITLDQVVFRYRPETPPVLHGISLDNRGGALTDGSCPSLKCFAVHWLWTIHVFSGMRSRHRSVARRLTA